MKKQELLSYIAGVLMALIFGLSFLVAKNALTVFTEVSMLAWRFTIAALALTGLRLAGILAIDYRGKPWRQLLFISLIYPALSFLLEAKGVSLVPASQAGVITSLMPVIALLLSELFLKEPSSWLQKIMVCLSVSGVIMITAFAGETAGGGNTAGVLLLIGSAACCALQLIMVRRIAGTFSSIEITFFMNATGAVVFDAIAYCRYRDDVYAMLVAPLARPEGAVAIVYLGLLCSVVAFFCLNYVTARLSVARASVFTNLATLISVLAGVLLGGEALGAYQGIGILLILTGVWGTNYFALPKTAKEDNGVVNA